MDDELIKFQEQESERIARDLHDSTVQNLTHLVHKLEIVSKYIDIDPVQAKLELSISRSLLKDTIKDTRNLIFNLRPMTFDDLGFCISLQDFLSSFESRYGICFESNVDENVNELSETILINIYRVIQEFCTNTVKHAQADKISLSIELDHNTLQLKLSDNGVGCDLDSIDRQRHFGLYIMKERIKVLGGKVKYISSPEQGFTLEAIVRI